MFDIIGRWNRATVYAATVDRESYSQVMKLCNTEALRHSVIRMMPDMHAAEGCTVGTSMTFGDSLNPSYVGGDIGCGMLVHRLSSPLTDFEALDRLIRQEIPSGAAIRRTDSPAYRTLPIDTMTCFSALAHDTIARSLGTLGGGNHFIEIDRDSQGRQYLVIHSGSRRLGRDVARYHREQAFFLHHEISEEEVRKHKLKVTDIRSNVRPDECFLFGRRLLHYLDDMAVAMAYADLNRRIIGQTILQGMSLTADFSFTTVHNYVDTEAKILRKGAVSAKNGETLLIPINMRDGSLLCIGKGNPDWNQTAPHGAGRVMKRSEAKERLSLDEYRSEMDGIFTTSVNQNTLDESPMAYRRIDDILDTIEPTVSVEDILTPVYNFKASKLDTDEETADDED
ncbi:MAG: RtcB family protein [Ruminococcaceae bacterium]|nr:RtcB family protein [Oscillospiraceae bacterium]